MSRQNVQVIMNRLLSSERKLQDICNIFARVNAKGMKLTTFDLMNAFLYPHDVKLRKKLWDDLNNEELKAIDNNMNEYLLKLISLVKQNYCSSKYIFNLIPGEKTMRKDAHGQIYEDELIKDGEEFTRLWELACKNAEKARLIIMNTGYGDFGAIKSDFIPNAPIVPVLGAVLQIYHGDKSDSNFLDMLKKWYWTAVFSEDYSQASDSVMGKDFRDWKKWLIEREVVERAKIFNKQYIMEMDLQNSRKNSSRYNAVLCMLALNQAKDFKTGRIVGSVDFSNERINDHHIFPKKAKWLDSSKCKTFSNLSDCIINRTLLFDETNKYISNKRPSEYLEEIILQSNEEKVREEFKTHFINEKSFSLMMEDNFDEFIVERERTIKEHIINKLDLVESAF